jgi:predicted nucleic acid-binding protein
VQYLSKLKTDSILLKIEPFDLIRCVELINEIEDVCSRPKIINKLPEQAYAGYNTFISKSLQRIKASALLHIENPITIVERLPAADPKDWYIHNLALLHDTTIVTGDKHLLEMPRKYYEIIPSAIFLAAI